MDKVEKLNWHGVQGAITWVGSGAWDVEPVDHVRRNNEPDSCENGPRVDPVLAIKEVQDSDFVFVDYGTMLRSAEDELIYDVGNPEVSSNTDRFALLFGKP